MGIFLNKYKPVLETYRGKPKEFILAEKELQKIIDVIKKEAYGLNDINSDKKINPNMSDINKLDSVVTVEKLIKKFFGFKDFFLSFYHPVHGAIAMPALNAFTLPKTYTYFYKGDDGKIDPSKIVVGVNVEFLFVAKLDLTAEELMAVILHEIGHNMDNSVFSFISSLGISIDLLNKPEEAFGQIAGGMVANGIIDYFDVGGFLTKAIKNIEKILQKIPGMSRILTVIWDSIVEFKTFYGVISLINFLKSGNIVGLVSKMLSTRNIFGYAGEKYADSFATSYGYGLATASSEEKMLAKEKFIVSRMIYSIPVLNWGYDLLSLNLSIILGLIDEHPHTAVRVNAQLQKLKRDAKDPNLNPRLRKELNNQIKELDDYINNKFLSLDNDMNRKKVFQWLFNYIAIKLFNGVIDFRELFELVSRHED